MQRGPFQSDEALCLHGDRLCCVCFLRCALGSVVPHASTTKGGGTTARGRAGRRTGRQTDLQTHRQIGMQTRVRQLSRLYATAAMCFEFIVSTCHDPLFRTICGGPPRRRANNFSSATASSRIGAASISMLGAQSVLAQRLMFECV